MVFAARTPIFYPDGPKSGPVRFQDRTRVTEEEKPT
ncbi:hypothetical protein PSAL_013020 [Pseudooceanicola algae]|uniref:Uncharacterized protein n=1 Tax=Pseudooceanicola algae TaxID=1537215 RepID=A0A418SCF3_9RHOB|nr:hypothetical protein PSAL_013020 [Pseudooceanicola algae]